MSKPKKENLLIKDPETVSAIIGNLKRCFSRSPTVRNLLQKYRKEEVWFKKDGSQAKKPRVSYLCFKCQKYHPSTRVQVDHIEPVVPTSIPAKHMNYDVLIDRLFCDESNLQILCKEHHSDKSKNENNERQQWLTKTKFIVYETINRVNGKKYIGIHKCQDYDDGYIGSGTALQHAIKKYGKDKFYRQILYVFDNIDQAISKEKELVNTETVESDQYYNLIEGGQGYSGTNISVNSIPVVCHQTGEQFASISAAADATDISISSIVKALDNPNQPVKKSYHFFTRSTYDPNVKITFPSIGRSLICLNNKTIYMNIEEAANSLSLNYKSLRNALAIKTEDGYSVLEDKYFIYFDEYDKNMIYYKTETKIKCVEEQLLFNSTLEAAKWIKHKKPEFAQIAINKAIREGGTMYGYHWEKILNKVPL